MPILILPAAQCNASHVACPQDTSAKLWHGIFLTGWARFCRNSAYRNSPLTSLQLRKLISQMETVYRIFSSLCPFVHLGIHSLVTSGTAYLSVPSLRLAGTLLNASSFCRAHGEQVCTPPRVLEGLERELRKLGDFQFIMFCSVKPSVIFLLWPFMLFCQTQKCLSHWPPCW